MDSLINKEIINQAIFTFWNNFLNFQSIPEENENKIISHSNNLNDNEILFLSYNDNGKIISAPDKYLDLVRQK